MRIGRVISLFCFCGIIIQSEQKKELRRRSPFGVLMCHSVPDTNKRCSLVSYNAEKLLCVLFANNTETKKDPPKKKKKITKNGRSSPFVLCGLSSEQASCKHFTDSFCHLKGYEVISKRGPMPVENFHTVESADECKNHCLGEKFHCKYFIYFKVGESINCVTRDGSCDRVLRRNVLTRSKRSDFYMRKPDH